MLRIIFLTIFLVTVTFSNFVEAADKPKVVVMDLGTFDGAFTNELNTENVGAMVSDYIIQALTDDGRFAVIDKELFEKQLEAQNLKISGVLSSKKACEIAKVIGGIDYIICGNANGIGSNPGIFDVVQSGGKFHSIKTHLMIRLMEVKKGQVVASASGEGVSKSSEVKAGAKTISIKIGTVNVPQECVHNATKKAALDAVAKLTKNFFNE